MGRGAMASRPFATCQELIPDENRVCPAQVLFHTESVPARKCNCWQHLKDAVLEACECVPFVKANGTSVYELFAEATHGGMSVKTMRTVLDDYAGFEGLKKGMDVGGGAGTTLMMLVLTGKHCLIQGKVVVIEYIFQDDDHDRKESGPCRAICYENWMIADFDGGKEEFGRV
ncbi:hypothetical protein ACLOJK_009588 [Asimina triloba]